MRRPHHSQPNKPQVPSGAVAETVMAHHAHPITSRDIQSNALRILHRLRSHGYKAYVVGGAVRDLLIGGKPKDFDVGTDATPGQIRRLFRNSRIIGRRFKLVHVYFSDGIIEVSTFRGVPNPKHQDDDGPITNDNSYGTPAEDAVRRDFTVNALFYDYASGEVIDHVNGLADIERQLIRSIGPAVERFREDPVRMLRACEFAARLGFSLDEEVQDAIQSERLWLEHAAPARLTEELLQLLGCGSFSVALQWMTDLDLASIYLPGLRFSAATPQSRKAGEFYQELDRRVQEKDRPSDAALLGALLLPVVEADLRAWERKHPNQHGGQQANEKASRRASKTASEKRPPQKDGDNRPQGAPSEPTVAPPAVVRQTVIHRLNLLSAGFEFSNARTHDTVSALVGFGRMRRPDLPFAQRLQLGRKPYFPDALELWELYAAVSGIDRKEIDQWHRAAGESRSRRPPKRPQRDGMPRRRRGRPAQRR